MVARSTTASVYTSDRSPLNADVTIAVTAGEPAGIGPDLIVQLAQQDHPAAWVVFVDPDLLRARAQQLNLPLTLYDHTDNQQIPPQTAGSLWVAPVSLATHSQAGCPTQDNAAYVLKSLELATRGCLNGQFSALTTGPVHKGHLQAAGFAFTGHTEFLAEFTHTPHVVMLLVAKDLRVAFVTTHVPLTEVPQQIDQEKIIRTLEILHAALQHRFGFATPRICVCGLNPHAGDHGYIGTEEITTILPALEQVRARGWLVEGPLSADTVFTPQNLKKTDAIVAMYHDQGLPVVKYAGFGSAVNITLGLPIIRTSVDHGTAFELAGTGQAESGSFLAALNVAYHFSRQ